MTAFSQLTHRFSTQPRPQPLRRCHRRLGPLRPVPPSFALAAGILCLRTLRFLCLSHNDVPLRCLLDQSPSSLTRRSWASLCPRCSSLCSSLPTWPCPGRSLGVEAALPLLLLLLQLLLVPHVHASSVVSAPLRPHASIVVSALGGVGGRLLLPDLRVSGSRSHHPA